MCVIGLDELTLDVPRYFAKCRRPIWMTSSGQQRWHGIIESQQVIKPSFYSTIFTIDDLALLRAYRGTVMPEFGSVYIRDRHLTLHWRHNDHDGVSNHQPHGCLLSRLFRRRSKKTSKLRVTGLCLGNSPGPVNSPHIGPVTRKMFPFDDVIMKRWYSRLHTSLIFRWNSLYVKGP